MDNKKNRMTLYLLLIFISIAVVCYGEGIKKPSERITFDFIDADVRNVLRILADISGKNIVIADDVKGKVTMKLDNVPWDEAFDIILNNNDLAKVEDENIIRVLTIKKYEEEKKKRQIEREEFRKERLERQRLGEELATETVYLSYANPDAVAKMLMTEGGGAAGTGKRGFLSEFGAITAVPWNNALIIREAKDNLSNILKIIKEQDKKPSQIQIECRIVQATSDFSREIGIQWGAKYRGRLGNKEMVISGGTDTTGATGGTTGTTGGTTGTTTATETATTGKSGYREGGQGQGSQTIPYQVNLPAAVGPGSGGALGIFIGSATDSFLLDTQLTALESEGKGKVISSPKVITSDNQVAKISQGKSIPYQTVSQSGTQTQFADAALSLEVTPTVTIDGFIKLNIRATKDSADFVNTSQGVPTINKREATTVLYVRDGETAVIGGIYETERSGGEAGLPILRHIPLLGWLFKKQSITDTKTELLIFITPRIIKSIYEG